MKPTATHPPELHCLPLLSSQAWGWEHIVVEQFQHPPGEGRFYSSDEHIISLSLAARPVQLVQIQADKTYTGLYQSGDLSITPAKVPSFARWQSHDHYLQIRLKAQFMQSVATETLGPKAERLELLPQFRTRDPQIAAFGMMLMAECQQPEPQQPEPQQPECPENTGSRLYIESLTTALAVHLLRQYAAAKFDLPIYEGGLSQHQLRQILDYIGDHLDQNIKLADLAKLLDMSQFHFSHLFKQSIGTSPYRYLMQQRVERAKQLLQQTDRSIVDIALCCGFNSHSHLSKQFRQLTGMTPRDYRRN